MGLLDLFGSRSMSERKIAKTAKLAANPYAQPDVRMREMQRLLKVGTDAALRGVLKRFAANAQGHIADEEEKQFLEDALVEEGDAALEPLRAYIKEEKQLTYALRAYRRIAGDTEAVRFFLEVLADLGPEDHRSSESKLQLVLELAEHSADPRVLLGLVPFLQDHSDDVRWAVLDLIEAVAGKLDVAVIASICAELGKLVTEDQVGPRIQGRAAEMLVSREWQIDVDADEVATALRDAYFLDKKKYVRKRVKSGGR